MVMLTATGADGAFGVVVPSAAGALAPCPPLPALGSPCPPLRPPIGTGGTPKRSRRPVPEQPRSPPKTSRRPLARRPHSPANHGAATERARRQASLSVTWAHGATWPGGDASGGDASPPHESVRRRYFFTSRAFEDERAGIISDGLGGTQPPSRAAPGHFDVVLEDQEAPVEFLPDHLYCSYVDFLTPKADQDAAGIFPADGSNAVDLELAAAWLDRVRPRTRYDAAPLLVMAKKILRAMLSAEVPKVLHSVEAKVAAAEVMRAEHHQAQEQVRKLQRSQSAARRELEALQTKLNGHIATHKAAVRSLEGDLSDAKSQAIVEVAAMRESCRAEVAALKTRHAEELAQLAPRESANRENSSGRSHIESREAALSAAAAERGPAAPALPSDRTAATEPHEAALSAGTQEHGAGGSVRGQSAAIESHEAALTAATVPVEHAVAGSALSLGHEAGTHAHETARSAAAATHAAAAAAAAAAAGSGLCEGREATVDVPDESLSAAGQEHGAETTVSSGKPGDPQSADEGLRSGTALTPRTSIEHQGADHAGLAVNADSDRTDNDCQTDDAWTRMVEALSDAESHREAIQANADSARASMIASKFAFTALKRMYARRSQQEAETAAEAGGEVELARAAQMKAETAQADAEGKLETANTEITEVKELYTGLIQLRERELDALRLELARLGLELELEAPPKRKKGSGPFRTLAEARADYVELLTDKFSIKLK